MKKYTGNALLQKTYRPSFKSKHTFNNKGELPQFYVIDSHPAIISLAMFNKVQEIRKQKSIKYQKIHIKNMETITLAGGIICPATPSFYSKPKTVNEVVATVVNRILDLAELKAETKRWGDSMA